MSGNRVDYSAVSGPAKRVRCFSLLVNAEQRKDLYPSMIYVLDCERVGFGQFEFESAIRSHVRRP